MLYLGPGTGSRAGPGPGFRSDLQPAQSSRPCSLLHIAPLVMSLVAGNGLLQLSA